MEHLSFVEASRQEHFAAMSLIHALGWRTTYRGAVPDDYIEETITDDHWVDFFRHNAAAGPVRGLLLCRDGIPVSCANYGPARSPGYEDWGEVVSFYTHPDEKGKGYGGALMAEVLRRLRELGFSHCYVLVLRENENARRFYAAHGFAPDDTFEEIPFPHDTVCVDLRYVMDL